jgi:pimeloyl-ACP methyl ester carboxylesterase
MNPSHTTMSSASSTPPSRREQSHCLSRPFLEEVAAYERMVQVIQRPWRTGQVTARRVGNGPPLVILPGIAATYRGYAALVNRLARSGTIILLDYPGDDPEDGLDLTQIDHDDLARLVVDWLDHLELAEAGVLGISFGSTLTLKLASHHPDRVSRAAIQGGFARRPLNPLEALALKWGRGLFGGPQRRVECLPLREFVLAWKHRADFPRHDPARWRHYVAENGATLIDPLCHRLSLLEHLDLRPLLPNVPHPILLIQGANDTLIPHRFFEELRVGLPRAESYIIEKCGHQPHYTHPELMADAILGWMTRDANPPGKLS